MKNEPVLAVVLICLVCTAGLLALRAPALSGDRIYEGQEEFYADKILDHINVVSPENALGKPDGRFAEIRPGGEMTLRMEQQIFYMEGSDDGAVVTKGSGQYGIAGLMQMSEEREFAWQPLVPGRSPGGFKLSTDWFAAPQATDTIRIVNDDNRSVLVDAVVGFKRGRSER
jgi:hypothetical protein